MGGAGEIFGAPARPDADQDGMPDEWEVNNGLDPNDPSDAMVIGPDGYANIEHYINGLVNEQPEDFLKPVTDVEANEITPYTAQLSWKNNDDRYEGIILEMAVQEGEYEVIDTLAASQTEYLVEELQPNTAYQFRLVAFGEGLKAIPSLSVQTKTVPIPTAPSAAASPYPADGFNFADTVQLELQWTGSENTDYYLLYTGTDPSQLQLVDSLTSNQFTLEGLESGKSHYWKVDAGNELGLTEGDVWSFSTRPYIPRGLVGAWLMDHESGTIVADSSIYANDGELNDLNDYSWTDGKVNGALDFTQAENPSHIYLPHENQLYFDKHSFSISMWVKSSEIDGQKYLIHKGTFSKDEYTGGTGQWYGIEIKDHDICN